MPQICLFLKKKKLCSNIHHKENRMSFISSQMLQNPNECQGNRKRDKGAPRKRAKSIAAMMSQGEKEAHQWTVTSLEG